MQELIEQFKEEEELILRLGGENERLLINDCIEYAESMLEKEKEVMYKTYKAYNPMTFVDGSGNEVTDGNYMKHKFEKYYNETFNTKEK